MDAKKEANDLHAKLTSQLNEQFGQFESDRYEQLVNRLKGKLSPKARKEAKNIMDILESLERNGTIGPGNYQYLKSFIGEYDVRVVADLIEPTEREIQRILSRGQGTSASGSTCNNNEGQNSADRKSSKKRKLEEAVVGCYHEHHRSYVKSINCKTLQAAFFNKEKQYVNPRPLSGQQKIVAEYLFAFDLK